MLKALKLQVIEFLENQGDSPYMFIKGKSYTGIQLATEVKGETEVGVKLISNLLILTLDLLHRNKMKCKDAEPI